MKQVAWYTFVVLATLTILLVLWLLRSVVVLFLLSIATAAAFRPLITFFEKRNLPRVLALGLSYLMVFGILAGLLYMINRPLLNDIQEASNHFAILYDRIKTTWPAGSQYQQAISEQLPSLADLTANWTGEAGGRSIQNLVGLTSSIFGFFGQVAMIVILSIYWSADYLRFERLWLALVPVESRPQARETVRAIEAGVGAYIRSEAIQSLLAGIMLWAGYQLLGLDYPVLLALLGALAWLIPWFGAVIAIIPPLLVGLGMGSVPIAVLAAVFTLLVLAIQELIIEPRFFTREIYSSVILVVIILILADEFGLIGLILAPLVSAAVQITLRYLAQPPVIANLARIEVSEVKQEVSELHQRVESVESELNEEGAPPSRDLQNLVARLKKLIEETQSYFDEHPEEIEAQKPPDQREKLPLPGAIKTNR